jgi:hypothetical protein
VRIYGSYEPVGTGTVVIIYYNNIYYNIYYNILNIIIININNNNMRLAVSFLLVASASAFVPHKHASPSLLRTALSMADAAAFDFDVAIIGCGVGGHGAALHSRGQDLNTAVFAGGDVGGTCVNRGCVPSKALLAASGRVRDMRDASHLASLGITVEGNVNYSREGIAAHAKNLANKVKGSLEASLVGLGCSVMEGRGALTGKPHEVKDEATGKIYTAKVSRRKEAMLLCILLFIYFAFYVSRCVDISLDMTCQDVSLTRCLFTCLLTSCLAVYLLVCLFVYCHSTIHHLFYTVLLYILSHPLSYPPPYCTL